MGKIIIVRHGETEYNVKHIFTGHTDVSLNAKGMEQAKMTGEALKNEPIDIIICSTMKRAKETANIINKELQLPMIETKELIEIGMGVYEGKTVEENRLKYSGTWRNKAPKGGESLQEVENRVFKAISEIERDYADKNVLVVAHGYIARVVNKYFNHTTEDEFDQYVLNNGEFSIYKTGSSAEV